MQMTVDRQQPMVLKVISKKYSPAKCFVYCLYCNIVLASVSPIQYSAHLGDGAHKK